ncbi:hypothetical protein L1887_20683 [Cichorium endivia]|nr:hypothetical protein L1887_20683 [Cichorium endivia]
MQKTIMPLEFSYLPSLEALDHNLFGGILVYKPIPPPPHLTNSMDPEMSQSQTPSPHHHHHEELILRPSASGSRLSLLPHCNTANTRNFYDELSAMDLYATQLDIAGENLTGGVAAPVPVLAT